MSEKRRALPPWMAKKEEKPNENKATVKRRRPKKPKSILYCMNERELVETAVSLLTNNAGCHNAVLLADHKVEGDFAGKTRTSTSRGNPVTQESSECSEAQEAAHVSETDLDVSEMETLPYTASPTHREPSGQMSGQVAADEEEEDALQLVREIFFSR